MVTLNCSDKPKNIAAMFCTLFAYLVLRFSLSLSRKSFCAAYRRAARRQQGSSVWARCWAWYSAHFRIHVPGGNSRGRGRATSGASARTSRYGYFCWFHFRINQVLKKKHFSVLETNSLSLCHLFCRHEMKEVVPEFYDCDHGSVVFRFDDRLWIIWVLSNYIFWKFIVT